MFHHIRGELVLRELSTVVLDCNGVGYSLTVSQNTGDALSGSLGHTVQLYTYLQVREDGVELFGFSAAEELSCFRQLISVSGVGPKAAMAILSLFTPEKFAYAVCSEDVKALSKASGVGAKTAARIVLELRDKIAKESMTRIPSSATQSTDGGVALPKDSKKLSEATDALTVLGYTRNEILDILRRLDTAEMSLEDIITAALKHFSKA